MNKKALNSMALKYELIAEDNDTVSSMGGDVSAAGSVPDKTKLALTWKLAGLYEPETPQENHETNTALKELENIINEFDSSLDVWAHKYSKIGALDTVAREQVAMYVAKEVFHLVKFDSSDV